MSANPQPVLPENLRPLAAELVVYYRELPQLLKDGAHGKYLVAKGDVSYGVWDTLHDATQFGHEKFPDGVFMAQKIDRRHLKLLATYFGPHPDVDPETA
jgi:hypothetical protein